VDSGNDELAKAQDLLTGSPANPAQASVWLWKAVGKNNVPAVLMLADLYARGDGVPRSCDQARILLTAALKRGASEAGPKMRDLQNSGCAGR
jgi:TPR repeat protein